METMRNTKKTTMRLCERKGERVTQNVFKERNKARKIEEERERKRVSKKELRLSDMIEKNIYVYLLTYQKCHTSVPKVSHWRAKSATLTCQN